MYTSYDIANVYPGWRIEGTVGAGSSAVVYKIHNTDTNEIAALKVISIPANDDVSRLMAQGYTYAAINQRFAEVKDSIVKIYEWTSDQKNEGIVHNDRPFCKSYFDGGLDKWTVYVKMELLKCATDHFREIFANANIDGKIEANVVQMGIDICGSLKFLHRNRIVHRDVKPHNIFVTADGRYKLCDFDSMAQTGTSGSRVGTENYMPPEALKGASASAGRDIYSLGLSMYWALNDGELPFNAANERTGMGELPRPKHGSVHIWQVINKACAVREEDRYANAEEMIFALKDASNATRNIFGTVKPVHPPVQQPVQPPVQPPMQIPVEQPVQPPVQSPVQPPVQQPVQPPVQPPMQPPVQPPVHGDPPAGRGSHKKPGGKLWLAVVLPIVLIIAVVAVMLVIGNNKKKIVINTHPGDITVAEGSDVEFSVDAEGDRLTYSWWMQDPAVGEYVELDETEPSIRIDAADIKNGSSVYCEITNIYGESVNTNVAVICVQEPIVKSGQTEWLCGYEGETVYAEVNATGYELSYEWYLYKSDGETAVGIPGNGNVCEIKLSIDQRECFVRCKITDGYGKYIYSDDIPIEVKKDIYITRQPENASSFIGEWVETGVEVYGDGLTYKWYFRNAGDKEFEESGLTGSSYGVEMNEERNGRHIYCVITDKYGYEVTTDTVVITAKKKAAIITQPESAGAYNGDTVKVSVNAEGDGLKYEWYFMNKDSGKFEKTETFKGAEYEIRMTPERDGRQLYCIISDAYGNTVNTDTVVITMKKKLEITKQPVGANVHYGDDVSVTVEAEGDGLKYSWYYKNPGDKEFKKSSFETNVYTVTMNEDRNGRKLYCVVSDKYGNEVKSDIVEIGSRKELKIVRQPKDTSVKEGAYAEFTVVAEGDGLTYQWYLRDPHEESFVPSQVKDPGPTYKFQMKEPKDGREVYCVITDKYGKSLTTYVVRATMIK